jgi:hypothetical protein
MLTSSSSSSPPKEKYGTFVIPAFLTRTLFLGAIVLAPFFGPKTVALRGVFAVAVVSFLDLIVPCAIFAFLGKIKPWEQVERREGEGSRGLLDFGLL